VDRAARGGQLDGAGVARLALGLQEARVERLEVERAAGEDGEAPTSITSTKRERQPSSFRRSCGARFSKRVLTARAPRA
jgi:hypothetical protein